LVSIYVFNETVLNSNIPTPKFPFMASSNFINVQKMAVRWMIHMIIVLLTILRIFVYMTSMFRCFQDSKSR
jgi:hypothetical protein